MSTIPYSELKKGNQIIINNQPHEIVEASSMFKGRGHSTLQAKLKNLITGDILSKTFHPSDTFEETEISKIKAKFLYFHRDKFFFCEENNSSKRFNLTKEQIGSSVKFLKPNQIIEGIIFKGKVVNISLPIIGVENDMQISEKDVLMGKNLLSQAFNQSDWLYAKIGCAQSRLRIADIEISFGRSYLAQDNFLMVYYSKMTSVHRINLL